MEIKIQFARKEQVCDCLLCIKHSELLDTYFKPNIEGFHGSKTLWESVKGFEVYWKELRDFLNKKEIN